MAITKEHSEFARIAMGGGEWQLPEGYAEDAGVDEHILSGQLDSKARRGSRTRLLRFAPGAFTTTAFIHDYWEEVLLIDGDLTVGADSVGLGGERFEPLTYACRPPGVRHGPFRSQSGCLLLEIHYFDPA